jgi:hypothetical protein
MEKIRKGGNCLRTLVKMALPHFKQAERLKQRTGRGDKPHNPEWFVAVLIMIAVLQKKKRKSAQYRYLAEHRLEIAEWTSVKAFPSRATYFRRYRRAHQLYRTAIRLQGQQAIDEGLVQPRDVAIDKSLVEGLGQPWHTSDQRAGKKPVGVDVQATWGYSEHHGWVYGYSFEVVVTATPGSVVMPLLASVDVASASEVKSGLENLQQLPHEVKNVEADSGYDANRLGEEVEQDAEGKSTGRHFLCPENPRHNSRRKTKPGGADKSRAESRRRRAKRREYLRSKKGKALYARRKKTVEPFNQWLKSLFELDGKVWHRGLQNNQTQMLAAIFAYQLLVRYNYRRGHENGQVCDILDRL